MRLKFPLGTALVAVMLAAAVAAPVVASGIDDADVSAALQTIAGSYSAQQALITEQADTIAARDATIVEHEARIVALYGDVESLSAERDQLSATVASQAAFIAAVIEAYEVFQAAFMAASEPETAQPQDGDGEGADGDQAGGAD